MITPDNIIGRVETVLAERDGIRRLSTRSRNNNGLSGRFRTFDAICVGQLREPRVKLLGSTASRPFLTHLTDEEATPYRMLWLPNFDILPVIGSKLVMRPIVATQHLNSQGWPAAVSAIFDRPDHQYERNILPGLLEEAEELLDRSGINAITRAAVQAATMEPFGFETQAGMRSR